MSENSKLLQTSYGDGNDVKIKEAVPVAIEKQMFAKIENATYFWCGLKLAVNTLVYFSFIILIIVILNFIFDDVFYSSDHMYNTCKSIMRKERDDVMDVSSHELLDRLKSLNQYLMWMLNTNQKKDMNGSITPIDYTNPDSLSLIVAIENEFDNIIYDLNSMNNDTDDMHILRMLDHANLQVAPSFQANAKTFKTKVVNAIKSKNAFTVSPFKASKDSPLNNTTLDVSYGMSAGGITQEDIRGQHDYLSHPDNITAFSSILQKTEISTIGDGANSRQSVIQYGLRPVNNYVSPYSGPGFGALIPSEEYNTDPTKVKKNIII